MREEEFSNQKKERIAEWCARSGVSVCKNGSLSRSTDVRTEPTNERGKERDHAAGKKAVDSQARKGER